MTLDDARARYSDAMRDEAFSRFGVERGATDGPEELEGSAPVFKCRRGELDLALKIAPGFAPGHEQVMGSTVEQVQAEVDFVLHLRGEGVSVAAPVPSAGGAFVETIDAGAGAAFFAYATEFVPGELLPDDDVTVFPKGLVPVWGRELGRLRAASETWRPVAGRRRLSWEEIDVLDPGYFATAELRAEWERTIESVRALERDGAGCGLGHGDPHHGNFMWHEGRFTFFDFDACHYGPYIADLASALYNCLPLPREDVAGRRAFALGFLRDFVGGYRSARSLPPEELAALPLLLKREELGAYGYYRKYWQSEELTERRRAVVAGYESRIARAVPVVAFEPGDLDF